MSRAVGIIPARWASTRFPGKPLHEIGGKSLLRHVWERASQARMLGSVIIATDDMRIAEAAFDWGAEVALTSPRHRSGTDRIAEVARRLPEFFCVVNIQGDEPQIDPRLIDRLVKKMRQDRAIEMITAAHRFEKPEEAESPHQVKVVLDHESNALYFSRSLIPFPRSALSARHGGERRSRGPRPLFLRHQGIYAYRRELLLRLVKWKPTPLEKAESLEQLRALEHGVRIHVLVTKHGFAGVDTPEDAAAMDRLLRDGSPVLPRERSRR